VGDVFAVPIDDTRVGVGQVVATEEGDDTHYLAIFDSVAPDLASIDIDQALQARVLFLALSFDAKLYNGDWTVVGHRPVSEEIPLPAWRETFLSGGQVDVVDYSGRRRRPASETEAELLRDQESYSPAILEDALRAKHGLEPWLERYTDLAPDETRTTARLFGSSEGEPGEPADDEDNEGDPDREQCVFVYFSLEGDEFGTKAQRDAVFQAEKIIEEELARTGAGELGGNEFGGGRAALFAYGPDADVLFAAMEPQLRMVPLRPAYALLRHGGPDNPQTRIDL
jgi:Immunity protein 26